MYAPPCFYIEDASFVGTRGRGDEDAGALCLCLVEVLYPDQDRHKAPHLPPPLPPVPTLTPNTLAKS